MKKIGRADCGPIAKAKRELLADPRFWDKHPRYPFKRLAEIYGVSESTVQRLRHDTKIHAR